MSGSSPAIRQSPQRPCCGEPRKSDALAAIALNRKAFVGRGMEQLFRRHQSRRKALRIVVTQEGLQHLAVGRKPIGPEVVAHELARGAQLVLDEGQRHLARGRVFERLEALGLGLLERFEHCRWQPRVLVYQLTPDTGEMHDGENAGAREIIAASRDRIGKQPTDMGIFLACEARHARGAMKPSMSPRSNSSEMVTPDGASSMRTPGGSLMAIFSGRPACSIPPRTQTMSDGFTPWSSSRMMRAHTQAVS